MESATDSAISVLIQATRQLHYRARRRAIRAFQHKHRLNESGDVDDATRAKLRDTYGS